MSEPGQAPHTFDLARGHLTITHVIMICVAILSGGIAVAKTYLSVSWDVKELAMKYPDLAKRADVDALVPKLETSANASAAERVKFYMSHGALECDLTKPKKRTPCKMIFPVPEE